MFNSQCSIVIRMEGATFPDVVLEDGDNRVQDADLINVVNASFCSRIEH
jgi:hypothetical protein